eukprot:3941292-Rhodomonas_salina.2
MVANGVTQLKAEDRDKLDYCGVNECSMKEDLDGLSECLTRKMAQKFYQILERYFAQDKTEDPP